MLPQFASHTVWSRLLGMGERDETKVTVFHGVPAMYARLVADHETLFGDARTAQYVRDTLAQRMRLMCAGSAPLPDTLFHKWEKVRKFMLWSSLTVFEFPLVFRYFTQEQQVTEPLNTVLSNAKQAKKSRMAYTFLLITNLDGVCKHFVSQWDLLQHSASFYVLTGY